MTNTASQFIKLKGEDGEILDMAMQQYEVGLYICLYKDGRMVDQFGSSLTQEEYIQHLKDNAPFEIIE